MSQQHQHQGHNSIWEPPSISGRPRDYLPSFDRACVDTFYDVVEKIRTIVFAEQPTYEGRLLYSNAAVYHSKTVLYPQTGENQQDFYWYSINFDFSMGAVVQKGEIHVSLYPGNPRIHIQKILGAGYSRVYKFDINVPRPPALGGGNASNTTTHHESMQPTVVGDHDDMPSSALTNLYPHLRLGYLEKLRLWLLLPPWQHLDHYYTHAPAYQDLLRRVEHLNTNQAQQRSNLEHVLTHMMGPRSTNRLIGSRPGGAEDIWQTVHRLYVEQQARERLKLYP